MAGKIFINYRRGDVRAEAMLLREKLAAALGEACVFMDVDNLLAGERFDLKLQEALAGTEVFLAVIGAHWMELLEARLASGERDFVREEIAAALAAKLTVIPVVMDRAPLPKAEALPEDIRELVLYHKHDVAYESFGRDAAALIEVIETHRRARAGQRAKVEAERPARPRAETDAAQRASEKERREIEAARLAREREAAETARRAKDAERTQAEALRQARELKKTAVLEQAATPWKLIAATVAAVAAVALAIAYWPHTPVQGPDPAETARVKPGSGTAFRDCPDCPEMVEVPAGSFTMGSSTSEEGRYDYEGPQHTVTISRPFAVGKFTVTFDEWAACVSGGGCTSTPSPSDNGWGKGRRPVINVSWNDAQEYVAWLSRKTGKKYRLLSEAEWEYAARAGTQTRYYWGDDIGKGHANCNGCGSQWDGKQTAPVGSFAPNAFGLYDMAGNVWQWAEDCWNRNYHNAPSDGLAWTTRDCTYHVLRGDSWLGDPGNLRAAGRGRNVSGFRSGGAGLRVARTLTP